MLRDAILGLYKTGHTQLVVDLTNCKFIDSTGLGMFLAIHKRFKETEAELRFVIIARQTKRALEITSLDRVFEVYSSLDAATT